MEFLTETPQEAQLWYKKLSKLTILTNLKHDIELKAKLGEGNNSVVNLGQHKKNGQ